MQPQPETPPRGGADEAERVARILARYRDGQPRAEDETPAVASEVEQALAELTGPDAAATAAPAPPPRPLEVRERRGGVRTWQRLVLAAVAVALIVLFWHRLAWIG